MKIPLLVLGVLLTLLVVATLVLYFAGSRLPRSHRSVVTINLRAPRTTVWNAITNYSAIPQWWPDIKKVRNEKQADGTEITWLVDKSRREMPFRTSESRAGERLVRVIASQELPFGGTWTYELADAENGATRLTLTEDGYINPPIFRAIAQWFIGLDATQRDFLTHLEKHLDRSQNK
jgi:hypothetical protein